MRILVLVGLFQLLILNLISAQSISKPKFGTAGYAGTYHFGNNIEKGRVGTILIYPETDSTILFYLDVNRGAPSYNMGQLYDRVRIKEGSGIFQTKFSYCEDSCKLSFQFKKNRLEISIVDDQDDCGFGFAVYANGDYVRTSSKKPEYFENEIYFNQTSPEEFNKK